MLTLVPSHPSDGPFPRPAPDTADSLKELFSVKDRVAIVTGGSGGIGLAAAEALAEFGANVILTYNSNPESAEKGAKEISEKFGVKAVAKKLQVDSLDANLKLVEEVKKEFGRIDIFIANAGMGGSGPIIDVDEEKWRKVNGVNVDAVFYAMKAVGPVFKEQGKGSFIATTSISARIVNVPLPQATYNAGKAAVAHLCRSVAQDWRGFARVNCIAPGFFDTNMGAAPEVADTVYRYSVFGRQGLPKELKGTFLLLASDASTYTTGVDYLVDGGYTLS
ncbi:hypothetical protein JCM8097_009362 [Rhodosporidiobolus ruineniae]